MRGGVVPCCLVVVTAADRAAATCLRGERRNVGSVGRLLWLQLFLKKSVVADGFHQQQRLSSFSKSFFENLGTFSPLLRLIGCKAHETLSLQNEKR